ncbi:DUF3995 domain-containing protein [Streptomyces sp. NPDC050560]|uniref:DUF3995 domain-containing protein n=1 Tax=Streptomyces sp. NPDC050560 TaxID=3365630 RepID=UPI00379F0EBF
MHHDRSDHADRPFRSDWPAYAAFWVGLLYAAVSAYWGAGGTAGLGTVGGEIARSARERDPGMFVVLWLTVGLKIVGALLGPALVPHRRLRRLPRRPVLVLSWVAAAVLTLYGGALVVGQALVKAGAVAASADMDRRAFDWHLFLWDPWFLVWGLLLGAAVLRTRGARPKP